MFKCGEQHQCGSDHRGHGGKDSNKSAPSHEEISQRAYELYVARGKAPGQEINDWLQAERELYADRQC
jgi:outer membrane protein TolC